GTTDPANTLTPTVTDTAITFGDITGLTSKPTARFDAGSGTVDGGAVITLDGRRLSDVTITNLDQSRSRSIVLNKIDLTPMAVDPATSISYVGGTVSRYTVQTPAALPAASAVAVTNRAPNSDIVLNQPVVNPVGGISLVADRSVTAAASGRVVA